jgi:hypothetical protein
MVHAWLHQWWPVFWRHLNALLVVPSCMPATSCADSACCPGPQVSIMEKMDEQILPAVSRFIGCSFRARPHELGNITFGRALVQALASPLGGIAGGQRAGLQAGWELHVCVWPVFVCGLYSCNQQRRACCVHSWQVQQGLLAVLAAELLQHTTPRHAIW